MTASKTELLTVLVCGGRDYADKARVFRVLGHNRAKIRMIVHGAAKGTDTFAGMWAADNDVPCLRVPAKWAVYGKKAGAIRNRLMLQLGKPDLVVAFPGGKGTAMMVAMATKAGVRVIDIAQMDAVDGAKEHERDAYSAYLDEVEQGAPHRTFEAFLDATGRRENPGASECEQREVLQ